MSRAVLVPGCLALLPSYSSLEDPVAELRAACLAAVRWLGPEITVRADPQGARVARALLEAAGGRVPTAVDGAGALVVGNGSARRTEKAPGHLDERAAAFDAELGASLRAGRPAVDPQLAGELWASVDGIAALCGSDLGEAVVDYDDDPFGVQYWVMRWVW